MDRRCKACDARCCRYFCIPIDKPDYYEEFENIRWYLLHRGVSVYIDLAGDWYIRVDNLCTMLDRSVPGGRCRDYARRPLVCRDFSPHECDFSRGGMVCEEAFRTAAELDAYARRMLGPIEYRRGLRQARGVVTDRTLPAVAVRRKKRVLRRASPNGKPTGKSSERKRSKSRIAEKDKRIAPKRKRPSGR